MGYRPFARLAQRIEAVSLAVGFDAVLHGHVELALAVDADGALPLAVQHHVPAAGQQVVRHDLRVSTGIFLKLFSYILVLHIPFIFPTFHLTSFLNT
jgi:hypothetical protein